MARPKAATTYCTRKWLNRSNAHHSLAASAHRVASASPAAASTINRFRARGPSVMSSGQGEASIGGQATARTMVRRERFRSVKIRGRRGRQALAHRAESTAPAQQVEDVAVAVAV